MEDLKKGIEDYFKDLSFKEEIHKYYVNGSPLKLSVSGLIKKYDFPTNWDQVSMGVAMSRGISQTEVLAEWAAEAEKGCAIGTKAHLFGEDYPMDRTLVPSDGYETAIKSFWDDLPPFIKPLALEIRMFHKEYMFAGTADILLYNEKTNNIIIGDYKTNKDLFKNHKGQKLTGPFNHLLDCPFNHYQLQLSFYQILLEQYLSVYRPDVKVAGRKIIWVKPNGNYDLYDLDCYTEQLKQELKFNNIAA